MELLPFYLLALKDAALKLGRPPVYIAREAFSGLYKTIPSVAPSPTMPKSLLGRENKLHVSAFAPETARGYRD